METSNLLKCKGKEKRMENGRGNHETKGMKKRRTTYYGERNG